MNRFLYRNVTWLYFCLVDIRMSWYIYTGRIENAAKIIREHDKWRQKIKYENKT